MEEDVDFDIETHVGEMAAAANSATASAAVATACPCSSFAAVRARRRGPLLLPPSPPEVAGTFRLRRLRTTHAAITNVTKARQAPTAMPR